MPDTPMWRHDVRVWDPVVRVFHWGTVALFATAFLSSDSKWLHEPVGYASLALVAVRVVWGFVGTRHARFADFVTSPRAVLRYLRALLAGEAPRHLGHNPAGGTMIVVLLVLLAVTGVSGWLSETDRFFGVDWVSHLHHRAAHLLLLCVAVHVLGVVVSSFLHRENLVLAMITGRKASS